MGCLKDLGLNKYQRRAAKAYRQIRDYPDGWDQSSWRAKAETQCGATLCYMGTIAHQNGGMWLAEPGNTYSDHLFASGYDDPDDLEIKSAKFNNIDFKLTSIFVEKRAARLLGIDAETAKYFSREDNTLSDIRFLIKAYLDFDPEECV